MRYIVASTDFPPFLTNWITPENYITLESVYVIIDLSTMKYTKDAKHWHELEEDLL